MVMLIDASRKFEVKDVILKYYSAFTTPRP